MTIEESLKQYILDHYKSLRDFCLKHDFAYSTISNIFKRGIGGSSVTLIISVCKCLNIDVEALSKGEIIEKSTLIEATDAALSSHELRVILAYRQNPAMQSAVDKLLNISNDDAGGDIAEDMAKQTELSISQNVGTK